MKQLTSKSSKLEIIDTVLSVLNNPELTQPISKEQIFSNHSISNILPIDQTVILNKLFKDEFIDTTTSVQSIHQFPDGLPLYRITFEGLLHLQRKGYSGEVKRQWLSKFGSRTAIVIGIIISAFALYIGYLNYLNSTSSACRPNVDQAKTNKVK